MIIPTIISQIITVIYNLADTWFVGLTNNASAVAAISLCLPVYNIVTACGYQGSITNDTGRSLHIRTAGNRHGSESVTEILEPHIPKIPCNPIAEILQFP